MTAELVILGSGTAIPTAERANTGLLLLDDGDATLIDPGPGSLKRARDAGVPVEAIARVLLTHHHVDHCLDLVALLFARKNPFLAPLCPPLEILGGPGTGALVESLKGVFGDWMAPGDGSVTVRELEPGPFRLTARIAAVAHAMAHTPASLGYRMHLASGVALAFTGDTAPCTAAVDLGRGADHYLMEAAFPEGSTLAGHLTPESAAALARDSGCRHLILTHFYPPVDLAAARRTAAAIFPGPVTIAEDGMRVPLASC